MGIFVFMNELQRDMTPEVRCSAVQSSVCVFFIQPAAFQERLHSCICSSSFWCAGQNVQ